MPATEETYRDQSRLHVVFAVSSIAMTAVVVWMILADHLRPWKRVQREFHAVETAKLQVAEKQKALTQSEKAKAEIAKVNREIAAAEEQERENARQIRVQEAKIRKTKGAFQRLDTQKKFQKAELDSQRSIYDSMIDRDLRAEARDLLNAKIIPLKTLLATTREYEAVEATLRAQQAELARLEGNKGDLLKRKGDLNRDVDQAKRVLQQKENQYFGFWAWFRALPLIDLAASPTKIQQISLPDLTINYNFKDVPRYDRCTTCHLGIDKPGYDLDPDGKRMRETHPAFASHPHLADGAMAVNPKGQVVQVGLYLDSNGPHKINSFGCTICHGGQGSGTDFTFASHEPSDLEEAARWEQKYGWHEIHFWDEPMRPSRFLESSCLKCHHQVTDIPEHKEPRAASDSDKPISVRAGYNRIVKYGCTGCHTIGGEGSFGPDLTDARQVGPNLQHIGSKDSEEWTRKWVKNPHAFRPDTRMPRFYGLTNNQEKDDWPKNHAEIHAITRYLFVKSTPPAGFVDPPAKADPARGKELFLQKGCMACHAHKEYDSAGFPESARPYAKADHGPNLSNIAAKFQSSPQGYKWLANWIESPESYHPLTLMPNLQLAHQDAADIASWLISVPGEWPRPVEEVPDVTSAEVVRGLDELVRLYKGKTEPLSQLDTIVAAMSQEQKLMFVGEKTIGRLGCFGCHNIPGFESAKPIGTPLNDWGIKSPSKLDFAHIAEYIEVQKEQPDKSRDGTSEYYQEKLLDHNRSGFLFQKIHRPRSYDYKKTKEDLKPWDDRLRMPQFAWADDPGAIEEVMTFVLGLTGEKIASKYLPHYAPSKAAIAQGERLLDRYNCKGCHVVAMPKFTIPEGTKVAEAMPEFDTNVTASYNDRSKDYVKEFYPDLTYDPQITPALAADDGGASVTIEGMPTRLDENDDGKPILQGLQVWKPVTIRGYTFNVGDNLVVDITKVRRSPGEGGNFAWLYATDQAEKTGSDFATFWNRLPPPLLREGKKVQTPWLTRFLKDPYAIRPAANLRMPRFHFAKTAEETRDLANYFAAVDGAEFPYQEIDERERSYLSRLEAKHPDYLNAGWQLMTKGLCVQCHAIGANKPTGGESVVNGPDLRQVADRFRPGYLGEWLARPSRLVPYTAMPQNVPPGGPPPPVVPKSFEDQPLAQVKAMRDTLLNYVTAVEQQLASAGPGSSPGAGSSSEPKKDEKKPPQGGQ